MTDDVEFPGLHRVKKPKGQVYYYAYRGGPRIEAAFGTAAFTREYNAAVEKRQIEIASKRAIDELTLDDHIVAYKASGEYLKLSAATQRSYNRQLEKIRRRYGDLTRDAIEDPAAVDDILAWRDRIATRTPRTANLLISVFRRLLTCSVRRGKIRVNILMGAEETYASGRRNHVWRAEHIEKFKKYASPTLWLVFQCAYWCGMREADILTLRWSDYDGARISKEVRKSRKTKAFVSISIVGTPLKALIDALPRTATTIVTNRWGKPYIVNEATGADGFRATWRKTLRRAGITDLTFHDLRGTAVTNLAVAGCTHEEIRAITGHSAKSIQQILERNYVASDPRIADNAMSKRLGTGSSDAGMRSDDATMTPTDRTSVRGRNARPNPRKRENTA